MWPLILMFFGVLILLIGYVNGRIAVVGLGGLMLGISVYWVIFELIKLLIDYGRQ